VAANEPARYGLTTMLTSAFLTMGPARTSALAMLASIAIASLGGACSSSEDSGASPPASSDELQYETFPNTLVLDAASLGPVQEPAFGTLVFSKPPIALDKVAPGNVLVAGAGASTPSGLLRFVKKVNRQSGVLTLETGNAPPQAAFRKLHVRVARDLPMLGTLAPGWPAPSVLGASTALLPGASALPASAALAPAFDVGGIDFDKAIPFDYYAFDGDGDLSTTHDQVRAHGEFNGGFHVNIGIDIDWGAVEDLPGAVVDCLGEYLSGDSCDPRDLLPEATVRMDVDSAVGGKASLAGAAYREFKVPVKLPSIPLPKVPVGILVFFPSIEFYGEASGQASSRFAIDTSASLKLAGSIQSSTSGSVDVSGFTPDPDFSLSTPEISLQANGKAEAGVRLKMKLYDVAGGFVGLGVYARVEGDQLAAPCWKLHGGLEAEVGYVIELDAGPAGLLTLTEGSTTLPIFEKQIASGACKLPEGGQPAVPGSGPTHETLLHPTFTPWSRTWTAKAWSQPSVDAAGLRWAQLTQSIDGRWVLASSQGRALAKADSDGKLVWARQYYRDDLHEPGDPPLRPVRVVPSDDATMLVATHPHGVMKVGQAGGVAWLRSIDLDTTSAWGPYGNQEDQRKIVDAVADGAGGMVLAGTYLGSDAADDHTDGWLLHLDREGQVVGSTVLRDATRHVYPTVLIPGAQGWLVSGYLWTATPKSSFEAFVAMVKTDGSLAWSKLFGGCVDAPDARPTAGIAHSEGDVVLVGTIGPYLRGFVVRFGPDGALRSSAMPWTGSNLSYFEPTAIRELPTTGYLIAGDLTVGYDPEDTILAALDVAGKPLWARHFRLTSKDPGLPSASTFAGLELTDDGGAMVLSHAAFHGAGDSSLWLFKALARDGSVGFDGSTATEAAYALQAADACAITTSAWAPTLTSKPVPMTDRKAFVEAVTIQQD